MSRRPQLGRQALVAAMPGTVAQLAAATGLHVQSAWRYVNAMVLASECHVSGLGESTSGRRPYVFAAGPAPAGTPQRTEPRREVVLIPDGVPRRDALTAAFYGRR